MRLRKGVARIILFAAASLTLALAAVVFVIDSVIESDIRAEMAQTLEALRRDVELNFEFYIDYHAARTVRELPDPSRIDAASLAQVSASFAFDTLRVLGDDGSTVASFGDATNALVRTCPFPDGRHVLEAGIEFGRFTRTEFGSQMMEKCCENWPKIIDGYLLCYRCADEAVVSSSFPTARRDDRMKDVIPGFARLRGLPAGRYHQVSAYGEESLCLMLDGNGYRFASVVPISVLPQYRRLPFAAIALVLFALVAAFTLVALKFSALSSRLQGYIEGEKTRLRDDLAAARLVQMSALPPPFPRQSAYSVQARMDPAKVVGGDFFDYQIMPNGFFYFLVADVAGKGISAAMFMMRAKSVAKQCLAETHNLADGLTMANALLATNNDSKLFVTVWVGILNPWTGSVHYVNAGHNPPVIRRADGSLEWVKCAPSLVLGLLPDVKYPVHELTLSPGDMLFLYTDGVTEAQNGHGHFFGEKRLERALCETEDPVRGLRERLDAFQGEAEPSDDVTMLALAYSGTPPGTARGFPCNRDVGFVEAVKFVDEELSRVDCPPDVRKKFLLAFDEVGSNVVNYSGAPFFKVKVAVESTPLAITLTLSDAGKPFNPLDKAPPDLNLSVERRVFGGFGIFITRQLMDDVIYSRDEGRNVLTLRKLTRGVTETVHNRMVEQRGDKE